MGSIISIQEFAKLSGIEASTLRYWDELGLFSPLLRNPETNYRYYSTAQLLALNFVTVLSDLAIPLKTIAKLRQDRDPEQLLDLLEKQEIKMDMEMRNLRLRYSIIHARRELIKMGAKADISQISVSRLEERSMILWPRNEYSEDATFIEPLAKYVGKVSDYHINLSFPVGGYFDNMESFAKAPNRPDHFISIDPVGLYNRKAGDYLVGYARGYYGEFGDLPNRMLDYAKKKSLSLVGPVYALYLMEEFCTNDTSQYLCQCSVSISRRRAKASVRTKGANAGGSNAGVPL
ncbi:MAG: MerR family transcriptional regulator [Oscillospiraceae bacterium]|nr:MerR family transcriptional regulator [Oscillospiraceae bacterium]